MDSSLLEWLESPSQQKIVLGLDRIRRYLDYLGNPEKIPSVLVTGTNGKGTTAAMLAEILRGLGMRVGLYTSPHLKSYTERFRISGEEISLASLEAALYEIRGIMEKKSAEFGFLTTFEILTISAFLLFKNRVNISVLEIGLGGRLDATNVVDPILSVITNIEMDHMEFLGVTLQDIAREKGGILRPGVPLITGVQDKKLQEIFRIEVQGDFPMGVLGDDFTVTRLGNHHPDRQTPGQWIFYQEKNGGGFPIFIPFLGSFQSENAALAISAAKEVARQYSIPWDWQKVTGSLRSARWPSRLEVHKLGDYQIIFDGAHNVAGIEALCRAIRELPIPRPLYGVIGIGKRKDARIMLESLLPSLDGIIVTKSPHDEARPAAELQKFLPRFLPQTFPVEIVSDHSLLSMRWGATTIDRSYLITGSLYLTGRLL